MATRVLIVEDHPMFRLGLATSLRDMAGVELVGERERVADVLEAVEGLTPDVVFLDVNLPDGSGLDANRMLHDRYPAVKVIVLTMLEDPHVAATAFRDGAVAFLVKGAHPDLIESVLRTVVAGGVVIPPQFVGTVMNDDNRSSPPPFGLTARQLDVLELMARGLDNHAIARALNLAEKTVRNNVSAILTSTGASSRAEAVVIAHRYGIGG
jgi:DNA-binding NarL/FixJ family response regulator